MVIARSDISIFKQIPTITSEYSIISRQDLKNQINFLSITSRHCNDKDAMKFFIVQYFFLSLTALAGVIFLSLSIINFSTKGNNSFETIKKSKHDIFPEAGSILVKGPPSTVS